MNRDVLIQMIVDRVVAALRERGVLADAAASPASSAPETSCAGGGKFAFLDSPLPAVMVCFCGGAVEMLDDVLAQLRRVRERANLHLIVSHTFAQLADTEAIRRALNPALVCAADEVNPATLREMLPRYKALVVPTFSINTLAKLNAGIIDSAPTTVLFEALGCGLPTLTCREGVDPEWLALSNRLTRTTPALLRPMLYNYIGRFEQWGAQWIEVDGIDAVENLLLPAREVLKKKRAGGAPGGRVIITREDLEEMHRDGQRQIALPPGAIVTHAAREFAADHSFRIDEASTEV